MIEQKQSLLSDMGKIGEGRAIKNEIGTCAQCHNKAEIAIYPNDNPDPICESCYIENQKLEEHIQAKSAENGNSAVRIVKEIAPDIRDRILTPEGERQRYIDIITKGADDKWVDTFIKEVVLKKVLVYDWREIIKTERWFSVLDLRRFALEVDPQMDKPKREYKRRKATKNLKEPNYA